MNKEREMNKKGIIGIGFLIVLIIAVLLLVGGLIAFISFNKFIIIGGGLIALTLIFGFKGDFTKQKGIFMVIFIGLGLVLILSSGVLQTTFQTPSHVFIDKDLGMITTSEQGGIVQSFFKNTAGSGISVSNVGQSVKVCDSLIKQTNTLKYTSFHRITKLNGAVKSDLDITNYIKGISSTSYCSTFTPTVAGTYEVVSKYTLCQVLSSGTLDCITKSSDDVKRYYLEVKPADQVCNKNPYTSGWSTSSNIENGKVMTQDVFKVSNDCKYVVNYKNTMTICNNGFLISGSTLSQTEGDGWKCVAPIVEPPIQDPECNVDLFEECSDGNSIVIKSCVNGFFIDTGLICSEIPPCTKVLSYNIVDNKCIELSSCTFGEYYNLADCEQALARGVIPGSSCGTVSPDSRDECCQNKGFDVWSEDSCVMSPSFMQEFGYWIVGGFFSLVILILIIWGVKRK